MVGITRSKVIFLHFEFLIAQQVWFLASRCLLIRWLNMTKPSRGPQGPFVNYKDLAFSGVTTEFGLPRITQRVFSMSFPFRNFNRCFHYSQVSITSEISQNSSWHSAQQDPREKQLSTCNVSLTGLLSDDRGVGTSTLRVLVFCGPNGPTLSMTSNKSVTEILSLLFWILTFQSCSVMFRYWKVLLWDHSAKELKEFSTKAWAVTTICHSLNGSMKHHELMER